MVKAPGTDRAWCWSPFAGCPFNISEGSYLPANITPGLRIPCHCNHLLEAAHVSIVLALPLPSNGQTCGGHCVFKKHGGCRGGSTSGPPPVSPARARGLPSSALPLSLSAPRVPHTGSAVPQESWAVTPLLGAPLLTVGGTLYVVCLGTARVMYGSFPACALCLPSPVRGALSSQQGVWCPWLGTLASSSCLSSGDAPHPPVEAHLLSRSLGGYSHQSSWCSRHHWTWRRAHLSIALSQVPTWQHPGQYLPHPPYPVLIWTVQGPQIDPNPTLHGLLPRFRWWRLAWLLSPLGLQDAVVALIRLPDTWCLLAWTRSPLFLPPLSAPPGWLLPDPALPLT